MLKIVWLAQYNVSTLQPELKLNRDVVQHTSSWIHSLSEFLALKNEIQLHIVTHSQLVDKTQVVRKNGIYFHVIKYSFPFTKKGFPNYFPYDRLTGYHQFAKEARKIIDEIAPDVLHVHGTEGGYYIPASKKDLPCIISIQGIISEYIKIEPTLAGFLQIRYERKAIKEAKNFGCRTNFDFDFVRGLNKSATIFDLPEAMNMVFYKYKWKRPEQLSLVFVGSVNKRKGIEDLIYALVKLKTFFPSILLKVIGWGTSAYREYLTQIIEKHDLKGNIAWLGGKSPTDVALELSRSTIFVLPSLLDNSPNCLAEAMAVGVPSVATNVGGIPSMIKNNVDGILFEKHDVDGLVEIVKSLATNMDLQDKLSMNARARALERNYPPNVANRYIEVYKLLLN
jgi:glycosyltransferase involved in cell wall biosynthesis